MKIAPISDPVAAGVDHQAQRVQSVRALKMSTNVTPGQVPLPTPEPEVLANSDTGSTTEEQGEATQPLSPQAAALAKQRRALQVKEREIAEREKALSERSASPADHVPKSQIKSDPVGILLDAGVTWDELTNAVVAHQGGNRSEISALEAKIKALEEGIDKKLTDRDAQTEQQVLAEMRRDADRLAADGDTYQLVRETKSVPQVIELIEKTYRKTGEVLDVAEAMQLVEDELLDQSLKLAAVQKVQTKIAPPAPPPQQQQRRPVTLSNRDSAAAPLTAKQRALLAFTGQLNK